MIEIQFLFGNIYFGCIWHNIIDDISQFNLTTIIKCVDINIKTKIILDLNLKFIT